VENKDAKTLLIDFDLEANQIRTLFKNKKNLKYFERVEDGIVTINKNLDILCNLDFIFRSTEQIDYLQIKEIIEKLKEKYNLIIIDTSSNCKNEYTKKVFYNCDNIIFLLEPNIIGIKKGKDLLEIFESDWKIPTSKIKLIINKSNIYQISEEIINELFPNIELIGKMNYNDCYNLMINRNIDKKEINKEYKRIYKKIYED